jgi:hypothetical protein
MISETTSTSLVSVVGKATGDVAALGIVGATLVKLLPPLAALISILWIGFQFYHSEPVKEWRKKRKEQNGTD